MVKVTHFHRRPRPLGNFSIESYFEAIRAAAPSDINITKFTSRYFSNGIIKRIYNILEAYFHQSDINHVTGDVHFLTMLMPKKKTILTIHDCGLLKGLKGPKLWLTKLFWFTLPVSHAAIITVNSEYTKQDLLTYVDKHPDQIKVIHIFIKDHFKPYPKLFNSSKPSILQIGTADNKNLLRVIPALEGIPCTFNILGSITDKVHRLLLQHQIDFTVTDTAITDEDLLDLYKECDILCFASTLEGFGMPIIEANAVGRVVLTSEVTSMPEIAGHAAHLVDPYDIVSIHAGFKKLIADESYRNQLIKNGFENIKRFDQNVIADQYFELYRNVRKQEPHSIV